MASTFPAAGYLPGSPDVARRAGQQPPHAGVAEELEAPPHVRGRGARVREGREIAPDAAVLAEAGDLVRSQPPPGVPRSSAPSGAAVRVAGVDENRWLYPIPPGRRDAIQPSV